MTSPTVVMVRPRGRDPTLCCAADKASNLYSPRIDLPTGMRLRQSGEQNMFADMTPTQCRMARAALQWTTADLSKAAGVGHSTVSRFETGEAKPIGATLAAMQRALEDAGAVFLQAGEMREGGEGVRLTGTSQPASA